jgi:hypothetical protein
VEQRHAEPPLQLRDPLAERRWRDPDPRRRVGPRRRLVHGDQVVELLDGDVGEAGMFIQDL